VLTLSRMQRDTSAISDAELEILADYLAESYGEEKRVPEHTRSICRGQVVPYDVALFLAQAGQRGLILRS